MLKAVSKNDTCVTVAIHVPLQDDSATSCHRLGFGPGISAYARPPRRFGGAETRQVLARMAVGPHVVGHAAAGGARRHVSASCNQTGCCCRFTRLDLVGRLPAFRTTRPLVVAPPSRAVVKDFPGFVARGLRGSDKMCRRSARQFVVGLPVRAMGDDSSGLVERGIPNIENLRGRSATAALVVSLWACPWLPASLPMTRQQAGECCLQTGRRISMPHAPCNRPVTHQAKRRHFAPEHSSL